MVSANDNEIEVPNYMQPGSVLIYDNDLNCSSGSYQLSNPMDARRGTGVNAKGSGKYSYGKNCILNFKLSEVVGTGQITYYGKPDYPKKDTFIGDHDNTLKLGDCATKKYVDDIPYGVIVTASNQNPKNTTVLKFTKNDCGDLPNAILDIFEDGKWSKRGICGLTVGNIIEDSVDNGKISHAYKK